MKLDARILEGKHSKHVACDGACCGIPFTNILQIHSLEGIKWLGKSHLSKVVLSISAFSVFLSSREAIAQTSPANSPGFSYSAVQQFMEPVSDFLAQILWVMWLCWSYLMDHPPAAVLLSGAIAFYVAYRGINSQREIARLRETFAAIDNEIRDGDVIKSRSDFKNIKNSLAESKDSIAKYRNPSDKEGVKHATTLRTILNSYENISLGVRYNILDEEFLFRWTRTGLIDDWNYLMPLVTAYRSAGAPNAYIEFEGLATSWQKNRSYRTGKPIKLPNRNTKVH